MLVPLQKPVWFR